MSHVVTDALFVLMRLGSFPKWFKPSIRLVVLCIGDLANKDGENSYPSMATICTATGLDMKTVRRALRTILAAKGTFITMDMPATSRSSARFSFDVEWLQSSAFNALERAKAARSSKTAVQVGTRV